MKILIFIDYYLPAFKAGGPTQSVANLVTHLGAEIDFDIVTRDRDKGDGQAFSNLESGVWQKVGHARVLYLPPTGVPFQRFAELLQGETYDWIYLNSFFSPFSSFFPLLTFLVTSSRTNRRRGGVIIAPRGEFAAPALALKPMKKRLYCEIGKALNLWKGVRFHAATAQEANDISAALWPLTPEIKIAGDLHNLVGLSASEPSKTAEDASSGTLASNEQGDRNWTLASRATVGEVGIKHAERASGAVNSASVNSASVNRADSSPPERGRKEIHTRLPCTDEHSETAVRDTPVARPLRIIFLSRISPMKNLDFALKVLAGVRSSIVFSIYGPIEDRAYWRKCSELMEALPQHVRVEANGPVQKTDVHSTLAAHDLFFLPTRGESYGHVIGEALCAGLPVLISDQTPWRGLEARGIGLDLGLDDMDGFAHFIDKMATLTASERDQMRAAISKEVAAITDQTEALTHTRALFLTPLRP